MNTYEEILNGREVRARVYSNKCKARRERESRRNAEKFEQIIRFLAPFSVGAFLMALTVALMV